MSAPIKACTCCGHEYTLAAWVALQLLGYQTDEDETLELRNCACGSTLAMVARLDACACGCGRPRASAKSRYAGAPCRQRVYARAVTAATPPSEHGVGLKRSDAPDLLDRADRRRIALAMRRLGPIDRLLAELAREEASS